MLGNEAKSVRESFKMIKHSKNAFSEKPRNRFEPLQADQKTDLVRTRSEGSVYFDCFMTFSLSDFPTFVHWTYNCQWASQTPILTRLTTKCI